LRVAGAVAVGESLTGRRVTTVGLAEECGRERCTSSAAVGGERVALRVAVLTNSAVGIVVEASQAGETGGNDRTGIEGV